MSLTPLELKSKIVRAGAGAGKTTQLTRQVLGVAEKHFSDTGSWPQIVVTTFTRKATQELRERLILKACESENPHLLEFVTSTSKLHISTIHGVLSQFLRQYAHLLGYDIEYKIVSETEAFNLAKKVLKEIILNQKGAENLLDVYKFNDLTSMARAYQQAFLQNSQLQPYDLKTLISVYQSRLMMWGESLNSLYESLIHSVPQEGSWPKYLAAMHKAKEILLNGEVNINLSGESILEVLKEGGSKPRYNKKNPAIDEDLDLSIKSIYKKLKDELAKPAYQPQHWSSYLETLQAFEGLAQDFSSQFASRKKLLGLFEMSDLELQTYEVIQKMPELGESFSQQWNYWLVDEFQDTSPLQVSILKSLIGKSPHYVVGDPQQSIYLFRGARSEVFYEKEKELTQAGAETDYLKKNYRSEPELLCFMNDFFKGLSPQFKSMEPKSIDQLDSKKQVATFAIAEPCTEDNKEKDHNEKLAIVNHIQGLQEKGVKLEEVCILSRKNSSLKSLAEFLHQHHIPTHVHASAGFYDRREIVDALSFLKFLVNPYDNYNLILLLRSPWCKVKDSQLVKWVQEKPRFFWESFLEKELEHSPVLQQLKGYLDQCRQIGISASFKKALIELGFVDFSHKHDSTGRRESNLWKLLQKLSEDEKKPGFNYLDFVSNNISDLSLTEGNEESDAIAALEPNRVNLMTIHASKGLQFKHVILSGVGKKPLISRSSASKPIFQMDEALGRWSLLTPVGEDEALTLSLAEMNIYDQLERRELEEHDRVLYVALTRAIESAFISWVRPVDKNSWVDKLNFTESPGVYEKDNYSYFVDVGPWEVSRLKGDQEQYMTPRSKFESQDSKKEAPSRKYSVSSLLEETMTGGYTKASQEMSEEQVQNNLKRSSDGVLIHKLMENLRYQSDLSESEALLNWFGEKSTEIKDALEYVQNLKEIPMHDLLKAGHVEWGFQMNTKKGILEGQVDLWGQTQGDNGPIIWVVDYKTGSTAQKEKAFEQLDLYAQALRVYGVQGEVKRAVVYPMQKYCEVKEASPASEIVEKFQI